MSSFQYNRAAVTPGIVHFGVGNFHRAHLEYYENLLLADADQRCWGISGAMVLPSDERLFHALKADNGIYLLTVCSPDGSREKWWIGSLVELNWGIEDEEAIIARVAAPTTCIVTLTITEGGYKVNPEHPGVFRYVAEALLRRKAAGLPMTILSCDNLQHNGDTARKAFLGYFDKAYPELSEWARENVTFPNSMVDRITPATKEGKITDVNCEDFIQWVVEDNFADGRPAWERVGVQFTDDVTPYENMKLSLLNASHTLLSYPSYLEGFRKVDAVLGDTRYRALIKTFMDRDVTPYVPSPKGVDLEAYKQKLLERFSNEAISDQVSRLCGDGIAKFEVYVVPTLRKMLSDRKDTSIEAFLLASYYKYLVLGRTEAGETIDIFEPHLGPADAELLKGCTPESFLRLSTFAPLELESCQDFMQKYLSFCKQTVAEGLEALYLK